MAMVDTHVSVHESVAGRYRPMEVAHRETNRISWYGEDTIAERPCLLTQVALPAVPEGESSGRITDGIRRTTDVMVLLCPTRVAPVVDAVEEAGTLWTVTDWIDGTPLGQVLAQQGTFHYVRAARIGLELLDILEAAHSEGITHGELSPGQVFVRDRGGVVLTGFGLAGATLAPRITAPSYASPEQARDERIGPAADLWALGAILYTLVEGHPPFRDRGRPEATMKGVDRLPMRGPSRAGPLAQVVQGLLRKDSRERLTRPVVRESLTRILNDDPYADRDPVPLPRLRRAYDAVRGAGTTWSGRGMAAGTALAVGTVTVAVLAATHQLPGTESSAATTPSQLPTASASASVTTPGENVDGHAYSPSATPSPTAPTSPAASASASPSVTASPSPTASALPAGFRVFKASQGFSVALPKGWKVVETQQASDAYRITFGASGDPRTLAVTYSTQAGPDPVAVWRDDVLPGLKQTEGFQQIGDIKATTYQGDKAADLEWLSGTGDARVRTLGRGFLIGGGRSFSLRWTTPADEWNDAANRQALQTFFKTFRRASN
ncbi:serine/threonine protein kinase [Streptomyces sp. NBC_01478]|uniref:serine/threonine-protein kinase n=1 Tax=Streptomyces sp. NBC_01478 TaxID=2903882 RepID=UPI002E36E22E|nr:serine/threonine-protein kinase [Streptomyces sp. NBC_01478]